ncbi:unnamed protein product [Periconia digitata]|uniref:Altered inheritance of mitochondria protein 41 n=1 Tax=Periconia digitata TaxID=1303443 RepID=A0A9W4UJP0_9PLEO|nr:unnamed protein product [Periconia digitata]
MSLLRLLPRASLAVRQPVLLGPLRTTRALSESEILTTIKNDLKDSLRAKDKPRLSVLRNLLASITNASKTPKPVANDSAFYALLQNTIKTSQAAIEDFQKAKRDDLVDKEQVQVAVLEEYVKTIDVVGEEEIDKIIATATEELKAGQKPLAQGPLTGLVFAQLKNRAVDAQAVSRKIKAALE